MEQLQLLIWESEVVRTGPNSVSLVARKPLVRMSVKKAARLLGCESWVVSRLFREGILSGWKPGAGRGRRDGRESNAPIVLDAGSVLAYKEKVSRKGLC